MSEPAPRIYDHPRTEQKEVLPRVPDELLLSNLTDTQKLVWIAVRKVQGRNASAFGSVSHYATVANKPRETVSRAISALVKAGWLVRDGDSLVCVVGDMDVTTTRTDTEKRDATSRNRDLSSRSGCDATSRNRDLSSRDRDATSRPIESSIESRKESEREARPLALASDLSRYGDAARSASFQAYRRTFPAFPPTQYQADLIATKATDIPRWQKALEFWAGNGYQPGSVQRILTKYDELKNGAGPPGTRQRQESGPKLSNFKRIA